MNNQELSGQIEEKLNAIEAKVEGQGKALSIVIDVVNKINDTVGQGFKVIDDRLKGIDRRLDILEGKEGMLGVNTQLGEIRNELTKIQKAYPYDDYINNIKTVQGEA